MSKTKADLLAEAEAAGISIDPKTTKADIEAILDDVLPKEDEPAPDAEPTPVVTKPVLRRKSTAAQYRFLRGL